MTSYNGPAMLAVGNTETEVVAHLLTDPGLGSLRSWGGFLDCNDQQALWAAFNASQATVCLPSGRQATVVVSADGRVQGSGPPPYGN